MVVMRILVVAVFVTTACTKPNPDVCCSDAADCTAHDLPVSMTCGDGLVCRGNQCIAQVCEVSANCDASVAYCVPEADGGRCEAQCTMDDQCPGFGQSIEATFCVSGGCVACRDEGDCGGTTPVCGGGSCSACIDNAQCGTGACGDDGSCVAATEIAYVAPTGSDNAQCGATSPCATLANALSITPLRSYIVIDSGSYASAAAVNPLGKRHVIGRGPTRPKFTRTTNGPIILVNGSAADVYLDHIEVSGATGAQSGGTTDASGIRCVSDQQTSPTLHFRDIKSSGNVSSGISTAACTVYGTTSEMSSNGFNGLAIVDSTGTFDRMVTTKNTLAGVNFDNGLFALTNSFVVGNTQDGVKLYSISPGNLIDFNTVADNGKSLACGLVGTSATFRNNIVVGNGNVPSGGPCTYPGSLISADRAAAGFVSDNDYHLAAGSPAIDAATVSTMDHDLDGDPRPQGAGRDIGADELKP